MYQNTRTFFTFMHTSVYLKDEEGNETGSEVKEDKSGMKYYTTVKSHVYPRDSTLCTLTRFFRQDVFIYKTLAHLKNPLFFTDSKLEKITNILKLIKMLLESLVDWMIEKFNRVSNNHRMVARTLEEEMKAQKALIQVSLSYLSFCLTPLFTVIGYLIQCKSSFICNNGTSVCHGKMISNV